MGTLVQTVTKFWWDGKILHVLGGITPSGTYVTGGDPLSFASLPEIKAGQPKAPLDVRIEGQAGFTYPYNNGTNRDNGKMLVMQGDNDNAADAPAVEIPAAAYPGGVTGDTIRYHAQFAGIV